MTLTSRDRARLRLIFGLVLAGVALWLAFAQASLGDLMRALASANAAWLLVSVGSIFFTVALVVLRLRALLACWSLRPAWSLVWNVIIVGQVANILIPFRLGDAVKVVAGQRSFAIPVTVFGGVVVVERLFDLIALSGVAAILLIQGTVPGWAETAVFIVAVTGIGVVAAVVIASKLAFEVTPAQAAAGGLGAWVRNQYVLLSDGLRHTGEVFVIARLIVASLAIASASILTNFIVMRALHMSVPFEAAALLWVILQCGNTLLPAPGGVGTSQLLTITTLRLWDVPDATALACSVLIYLIARLPKIALLPFAMSALERQAVARSLSG